MKNKRIKLMKSFLFLISSTIFLLLLTIDSKAQITSDDAKKIVLEKIIAENIEKVEVFFQADIMKNNNELELPHKTLKAPYTTNHVFFIDDMPFANWEHPCRYIFVDAITGKYEIIHEKNFPKNMNHFEKISGKSAKGYRKLLKNNSTTTIKSVEPNPHLYAVIINGGYNSSYNYVRYWNNISAIFCTLTDVYGYIPENIYVHSTDGTATNNHSSLDLDNDGEADIDAPSYETNIESTFQTLANTLSSDDQLFLYVTDHGGRDSTESYIYLWGGDILTSTELKQLLLPIDASEIIVFMEQCKSGGFITDQNNITGDHRVINTACSATGYSVAECWITDED